MVEQQVMETSTKTQPAESRAAKLVREAFDSGRPVTYIHSAEEQRVARVLHEVGRIMSDASPVAVWTWTMTEGLRRDGAAPEPDTADARRALDFVIAHGEGAIFHFKDFHAALGESAEARRRLRDAYESCLDRRKFVVISSPVRLISEDLERMMLFLELRPPDHVELMDFLREEAARLSPDGRAPEETVLHQVARALLGLTLDEARYALRRALAQGSRLGLESMPAVLEEKRLLINRSGTIEFIPTGTHIAEVGGLQNLKKWLRERRKLFELRDEISSEIVPKGILLMGIPGCGKSLCVRAAASHFGLPLYRVDMVEIFSGRHGKPEGAFVQACRMMEDMAPAVLWFDEIERGVTATVSGGEEGRIFGFFLTWMQEKARGLFVAATANRINELPAEMIRKGRFDEVFFVDLPTEDERVEIFRIHLLARKVDPAQFQLEQLLQFTVGWAGSEIEQCVVSAITKAKLEDRELTEQDLILTAASIVPLSRTMKEQISYIRDWAFERAMRASPKEAR
ncbi:MAG: AAA family ATPase [Acidobacteria bacterium]|nr:AAA family ATPase [Acidobacteriota bacterium]